ncbi:MAG: type II toxin-antitoxin system HicB family antitoxin [Lachnospiraceae bacterium]|nr:type II toxin-antitoxin system HicB family antitoxin [Lachnospiraceae bacterium]MCD8348861.1 type II toxin-antitoxin system HicB family antitoxin [Lachnospiraceae bacterium]
MKKLFYPALFHAAEEGGYWVTFPDIPECVTEGDDMEEAYSMAVDALGLALTERMKDKEELPCASKVEDIKEDGAVVIVQFDLDEYNRKHNSKAVKKTLSIPEWLNEEAMAASINFSQVLQEALMTKLRTVES